MKSYWDERFSIEGMIWGKEPSNTAYHALELFRVNNVESVLVPGSGYGRNTKLFSSIFHTEGIELSHKAIGMAMEWDPKSIFIQGSVLDPVTMADKYDAVYCYDVLHLFLKEDRRKLIGNCVQQLNDNGIMYFTCFSDKDSNNGVGKLIEEGTYEYINGKHAHFFSEEDLIGHFEGLKVIEIGTTKEILIYNDNGTKEYSLRYIIVKKS
jgi:SAM-dependent methyltransferase